MNFTWGLCQFVMFLFQVDLGDFDNDSMTSIKFRLNVLCYNRKKLHAVHSSVNKCCLLRQISQLVIIN